MEELMIFDDKKITLEVFGWKPGPNFDGFLAGCDLLTAREHDRESFEFHRRSLEVRLKPG
jgi:hypothetical protein